MTRGKRRTIQRYQEDRATWQSERIITADEVTALLTWRFPIRYWQLPLTEQARLYATQPHTPKPRSQRA